MERNGTWAWEWVWVVVVVPLGRGGEGGLWCGRARQRGRAKSGTRNGENTQRGEDRGKGPVGVRVASEQRGSGSDSSGGPGSVFSDSWAGSKFYPMGQPVIGKEHKSLGPAESAGLFENRQGSGSQAAEQRVPSEIRLEAFPSAEYAASPVDEPPSLVEATAPRRQSGGHHRLDEISQTHCPTLTAPSSGSHTLSYASSMKCITPASSAVSLCRCVVVSLCLAASLCCRIAA